MGTKGVLFSTPMRVSGVGDLHRRTGGSLIHQHALCVFLGFHLHGSSFCHVLRLSGPCCLIGSPASRPLLSFFDP